jgi:hypothetical protein
MTDKLVSKESLININLSLADLYSDLEESTRDCQYDLAKLARMFNRSLNSIPPCTASTLEALIIFHYLKNSQFSSEAVLKLQQSRNPVYGQNVTSGGKGVIVRLENLPPDLQKIVAGYIFSFIEVQRREF